MIAILIGVPALAVILANYGEEPSVSMIFLWMFIETAALAAVFVLFIILKTLWGWA